MIGFQIGFFEFRFFKDGSGQRLTASVGREELLHLSLPESVTFEQAQRAACSWVEGTAFNLKAAAARYREQL